MATTQGSRVTEEKSLDFFPDWRFALKFTAVVFPFFLVLLLFRIQLCPYIDGRVEEWKWEVLGTFPVLNVHLAMGLTSMVLLTACYFPGVAASYLQLYQGMNSGQFPSWLDTWLRSRKQLGLLCLLLCAAHVVLALVMQITWGIRPTEWRKYMFFSTGVFAFLLLIVMGITSLPSVSAAMTRREFAFIQRYFGWTSLILALAHIIFVEWKRLIQNQFACILLPSQVQIVIIFPALTILMKLFLILPWVERYLTKIRSHERLSSQKISMKES